MMLPGSGTDNGNKALVIVIGGLHSGLDSLPVANVSLRVTCSGAFAYPLHLRTRYSRGRGHDQPRHHVSQAETKGVGALLCRA